jgi:hypothetical protein
MSFSLPRFLGRTPSESLEPYFAARGFSGFDAVEWRAKPKQFLRVLLAAIEALPEQEREHVFDDFERVDQLCDEAGQVALRWVLASDS